MQTQKTVLCIVGALFGRPFMLEAKRLGWNVILLTEEKYLKEAWPREQIDEVYGVPDLWDEKTVQNAVCYLARHRKIDKIVGLGEFDIEVAARLREYMRYAGMGETTSRYMRDKLAMRMKTEEDGIPVPAFSRILNHEELREYMERVEPTWVLKPRMSASAARIEKMNTQEEVWAKLEELGDKQTGYLLEKFIPGDVYHVDSVVANSKVVYASVSKYGKPMLDLNTSGGIFTTHQIKKNSPDERALQRINKQVMKSLGMVWGTTHAEFIKSKEDGTFYFLETAARVGGARIPDVIWHATGLCQWHEWAKIELLGHESYSLPALKRQYGGGIFTLAKQESPNMSAYTDPEIAWVQKKKYYAGLILTSPKPERIEELLQEYAQRFAQDFMSHLPAQS
jgi:phosphoribosylaminoimidazole carboxylase (NCAIR synthetase)